MAHDGRADPTRALLLLALLPLLSVGQVGGPPTAPAPCVQPRAAPQRGAPPVAVVCRPGAEGGELRGAPRLLFGLALDVNRASARALEAVPGIGPARAHALVEARRTRPFCRWKDLERLRGVGPRTVSRWRGWLAVEDSIACRRRAPQRGASRSDLGRAQSRGGGRRACALGEAAASPP